MAAVTILSETLRLELAPFGVAVVTCMLGNKSNFHANDAWHGLSESSPYKKIETQIAKTAVGEIGHKKEKADDFARRVVDDILRGASGQVWRGAMAQTTRFMGYHALMSLIVGPDDESFLKPSLVAIWFRIACCCQVADSTNWPSRLLAEVHKHETSSGVCLGRDSILVSDHTVSVAATVSLLLRRERQRYQWALLEVDEKSSTVAIGSGASWGQVYRKLDLLGLAVPGGWHSQVGVGGLTLGAIHKGGLSHFSGQVGLVCDNVAEYEIVLASGDTVRATDMEYQDLLRALRGGSNNFGIVTRFVFRTFRQGRLWGGILIHPLESKDQQLQAFYDFIANPDFDPHAVVYTKPETNPAVIKPFSAIGPVYMNTLRELSPTELTREQDAFNENGLCQIMLATTYYLDMALLHKTYDIWHISCGAVRSCAGIVWSLSFQPIVPLVISHSPFLQSNLSDPTKPVVIAQLTGTWKEPKETPEIEAAALKAYR